MAKHNPPTKSPNVRLARRPAFVACTCFLAAMGLSPDPGGSLGMPWLLFLCTWGVMLVASFLSLAGFIACRIEGERISVFYLLYPVLFFGSFVVFVNLRSIVRALVS